MGKGLVWRKVKMRVAEGNKVSGEKKQNAFSACMKLSKNNSVNQKETETDF